MSGRIHEIEPLDTDWVELILEAKRLGIEIKDIQEFLTNKAVLIK